MKVYTLLGFTDYEGSTLVGVFGSIEDVLQCVKNTSTIYYDSLGYVESELGKEVGDVLGEVVYVGFTRHNGEVVEA